MSVNRLWNKLWDWVLPEYTDFEPFILYTWTNADRDLITSAIRAGTYTFIDVIDFDPKYSIVVMGYDCYGGPIVERLLNKWPKYIESL